VWSRRGRFIAYDDQGRGYEIRYSADDLEADSFGRIDNEVELWTHAGELVERLRKGEYRIAHIGVVIRTDSPKAP
jgi:hypothetical protein